MRDLITGSLYTPQSIKGFTDLANFKGRHFLLSGDLLLITRGTQNPTIAFEPIYELTVAAAAFYVIRPNERLVDSRYLHWYLNQPDAQNHLQTGKEAGSTVAVLPIDVVRNVPVPLPPLPLQRQIGQLARLAIKEQELIIAIAQKQRQKRNRQLTALINAQTA